jgi:hypothetical protein
VERVVKVTGMEAERVGSILEENTTGAALKTGSHGYPMTFHHRLLQEHPVEKHRDIKSKR